MARSVCESGWQHTPDQYDDDLQQRDASQLDLGYGHSMHVVGFVTCVVVRQCGCQID